MEESFELSTAIGPVVCHEILPFRYPPAIVRAQIQNPLYSFPHTRHISLKLGPLQANIIFIKFCHF